MKKGFRDIELSEQQLETELQRTLQKKQRWVRFKTAISILLVISALMVLITALWFPIYPVTDSSMEPDLKKGQIVISCRPIEIKTGDIVVLWRDNQIRMNRIIAIQGDSIHIDGQGKLSVNGNDLPASVLMEHGLTYPYQVPEDHLAVIDMQQPDSNAPGKPFIECISQDCIVGKLIFRIWPLQDAGVIE
ncbi:MAG: signal peptidase I [Oscillospiraceae bacterium]|nr:signal peptidase I [Oscillospiraceae bacterium]